MMGLNGAVTAERRKIRWSRVALGVYVPVAFCLWSLFSHRVFRHDKRSPAALAVYRAKSQQAENLAIQADKAWRDDGDFAKAEQLFRQSLALRRNSIFTKMAFAEMLEKQGRTREAYLSYKDAVHPNPRTTNQGGYFSTQTWVQYIALTRAARAAGVTGAAAETQWAQHELVLTAHIGHPNFPKFTKTQLKTLPVDALADLAIGLSQDNGGSANALATFQNVAKGHPRLGLAHLYIGRAYELTIGWGATPAKAAYRRAILFGDDFVKTAAQESLK